MLAERVSIGVAGALGPKAVARIARLVESAGFHALWINDTPGADSLVALEAAAGATKALTLATGVIPVDRRASTDIALALADLPHERIVIGIGSGAARDGALSRIERAVLDLRDRVAVRVLVGALGPRMRHLAADQADGLILNWLPPKVAQQQAAEAKALSPTTHVALYLRTALDDRALPRLEEEVQRYAAASNYAANFARLGIRAGDCVLTPATFHDGIDRYRKVVDEVVMRSITEANQPVEYERFVERAASALH